MTESDKASTNLLTEEAYAQATGATRHPASAPLPWDHFELARLRAKAWGLGPHLSMAFYEMCRQDYYEMVDAWSAQMERHMEFLDGFLAWRKKQRRKNAYGENQHQLGPREFTLTYSPTWGMDDEEAQETMRTAIERLTRYYKDEIIEFHAIGEFGRDGRSHVHGWYHLTGGRKITDKNFKRAYPRWNPKRKLGKGFEGGHHQTIERVSDFAGYAEKHLEEAWMKTDITNGNNARSASPLGVLEGLNGHNEEAHGSTCRGPNEANDEDSD